MKQERRVEPCGCIVTTEPGHVHTKLCDQHKRETFDPKNRDQVANLDLVGG